MRQPSKSAAGPSTCRDKRCQRGTAILAVTGHGGDARATMTSLVGAGLALPSVAVGGADMALHVCAVARMVPSLSPSKVCHSEAMREQVRRRLFTLDQKKHIESCCQGKVGWRPRQVGHLLGLITTDACL